MSSTAKFKIRNITLAGAWSPYTDRGFDAAPGNVLEVQLEDQPALDVSSTLYSNPVSSLSAPAITIATGGVPTPTQASGLLVTLPVDAAAKSYLLRCQTNGGVAVIVAGSPDYTINTAERIVAVRSPVADLRKMIITETDQYESGGWPAAQNEEIDAVDAALGAVMGTIGYGSGLFESPAGTANVGANADGSITVAANDIKVGILATDAQHGVRGGGTQHADVVAAGASGFMVGADKTFLDDLRTAGPSRLAVGAVQTAVVGPTTITGATIPLPDNCAAEITTTWTVRDPASGGVRGGRRTTIWKRHAGGAATRCGTDVESLQDGDVFGAGVSVDTAASTNDVIGKATGLAGTTLNWTAHMSAILKTP